jgi:hypothetical protein
VQSRATEEEMAEELLEALTLLRTRLRASWLDEPERINLSPAIPLSYRPNLESARAKLLVRGEVRDIQGQLLLLENEGRMTAYDGGSLQGYHLRGAKDDDRPFGQTSISFAA